MTDKYIVKLNPETFYLVNFGHHLIGKGVVVANKILTDDVSTNNLRIIGITDDVNGDTMKVVPKNLKNGRFLIVKEKGLLNVDVNRKHPDQGRIVEVYKQS